MAKNKQERRLAKSIDDLVEIFDNQALGDDWDQMEKVEADVDLRRRIHLVTVEEDLIGKIAQEARSKHVSTEALINSILRACF